VGQGPRRIQQGLYLIGMVGVVVVHLRPVIGTLVLEASSRTGKRGKALLHGLAVHPQQIRGGRGGQRIGHVVAPGDVQRHVGIALPEDHYVELTAPVEHGHVIGIAAGAVIPDAVREQRTVQPRHGGTGACIVQIGHHAAGALRHQLRKPVEGLLDVRQILEEVQMVGVYVEDHRHGGEEVQEGVAVFAALQNDGVALSHPIAAVQQGQRAADHDGGVLLCGHEDVRSHGRGGGLTVGAGDAQGVAVAPHNAAPGLGPLVHGDTPGDGAGDLGIAVVDGGGADHGVAVFQILGGVADGHLHAQGPQVPDGVAVRHVGALHHKAHALQYLGQRAHGYAADTGQMDALAGL